MSYILKVEAIHPRGRQAKTGVKRGTKTFTEKVGKGLVENADFLAAAIKDLIEEFKENGKDTKLLFKLSNMHSSTAQTRSPSGVISFYLQFISLLPAAKKTVQRLYRDGSLRESVTSEQLNRFFTVVDALISKQDVLKGVHKKMQEVASDLKNLGFTDETTRRL